MSKISIIIPNYNNSQWLPKCLDSVLSQEGSFEKEIIVVDDQSTDESWKILQNYQEQHASEIFIYKNPDKGGNNARNFGYSKSSGDFIQWLDSDDMLLQGKFSMQLKSFEDNPLLNIVYSDWRMDIYNEKAELLDQEFVNRQKFDDFTAVLLVNKLWNVPNSYLMKREICDLCIKNNAWSKKTKVGQDREFFTIAAILGGKFGYCKGLFSVYNRWSNESISKKYKEKEIILETIRLNQRFFELISNSNLVNKNKYHSILNAELLSAIFYQPSLSIPRFFPPWQISLKALHWKLKLISPILYIKHLLKKI